MAWFDKKKKEDAAQELLSAIPDELKEKTPAELAEILKEAKKSTDRVTALENERKTEREKVQTIESEFQTMKERLRAAEANNNKPPDHQDTPFEPDFVTDGVRTFQELNKPTATLAVHGAVNTARILAQQSLDNQDLASPQENKTMDGRLFRAWEKEISEMSKKYNPIQLTTVDAWLGIFYYVKGTHTHELMSPETRKAKYSFLEPARQQVTEVKSEKKDGVEGLTDEEKRRAELTIGKTQGLTPAEAHKKYAERKAQMQFVH